MSEALKTQELVNLLRGWAIDRDRVPKDWMSQAADKLEELIQAIGYAKWNNPQSPPPKLVRVRGAIAVSEAGTIAWVVSRRPIDDAEALLEAADLFSDPVTHQAIITADIPPLAVPEVRGAVERS